MATKICVWMTTGHKRLYEVAHLCGGERFSQRGLGLTKEKVIKDLNKTQLAPECLLAEMVKSRVNKHLTYLVVSVDLPQAGNRAGWPLELFGMNEGKDECESEPCYGSRARLCSHPAWRGKRNTEWHASPRAPQLIILSWPYLAPRCFHLSLINCQPRASFVLGGGGDERRGG